MGHFSRKVVLGCARNGLFCPCSVKLFVHPMKEDCTWLLPDPVQSGQRGRRSGANGRLRWDLQLTVGHQAARGTAESEVPSYFSAVRKSFHMTNLPFCSKVDLGNTGGDFWIKIIGVFSKEKKKTMFTFPKYVFMQVIQNNINS